MCVARFGGVAKAEIGRRDVIEQGRLLDVEQAQVALADVLGLLEADDRFLVTAAFDVGAAEPAVILDQRRGVLPLRGLDDLDRIDEVVERVIGVAKLRLDQPERRQVGRILGLALVALRIDDGAGRR